MIQSTHWKPALAAALLAIQLIAPRVPAQSAPTTPPPARAAHLAAIEIDYPAEGSIFPPELPPPTFLWRDPDPTASVWQIEVTFGDRSPGLKVMSRGELMRLGAIDPDCVTPTNAPSLTALQAVTHTWIPDQQTWESIKRHSSSRPATIAITGRRDSGSEQPVSAGRVNIHTSKDPVGAPVFYRDVPLMPTEGEQGTIKPLPATAIGLIKWKLRDLGETGSRTVMENQPTCANCHSFSLDGKTMGIDVDGPQNDKGLYALVGVDRVSSIRNEDVIKWSSFGGRLGGKLRAAFMSQVSPDGRYVVTTIEDPRHQTPERRMDLFDKYYSANFKDHRFLQVFYPTRGILAWYSRESGHLEPLPGANDPEYVQTDGVWSPDGKYVVFARAPAKSPYPEGAKPALYANDPNETPIQYDLYRVPFNGGRGGVPERIEGASQNGMSNNFPKVSPDGRWIVFVRCRNGQLMRPDSQLYIVPFGGGVARRMNCNTPLMNSWHSFSPNGRWLVFSSKSRSPFTQMYLTHIDRAGMDGPPILVENTTAANRAVNLPEFVNIAPDGLTRIETPATEFFRVFDTALELARQNQPEAALREWQRAVELNDEEPKAFFNLGLALDRVGRIEEAIGNYRKTIELDPENSGACTNLAVDLAQTGRIREAVESFEKCVALNPTSATAHANLAAALLQDRRYEEAIEHSRKALDVEPDNSDAHGTLGSALAMSGKVEEAIPELEKAVAIRPDVFEYQFNLGRFLVDRKRFAEAITRFEHAVVISRGREPHTISLLALSYGETGRLNDALRTSRRALELATEQGDADLVAELKARIEAYESRLAPR